MKLGDFTTLAKEYKHRTGYSETALRVIRASFSTTAKLSIADVGAGTGKLTQHLLQFAQRVWAVEPNDAMRAEGEEIVNDPMVTWSKGSGEETGLKSQSYDWVLMGSSFHWVNLEKGLQEFHRILKPGASFTALWNPRDVKSNPLHKKIESIIYNIAPNITRVSSGSSEFTERLSDKLVSTGLFEDAFFLEAPHEERMSPERYLGAWRSVNDIQTQAGPENFKKILVAIENEVKDIPEIVVPYTTRAWTVRKKG